MKIRVYIVLMFLGRAGFTSGQQQTLYTNYLMNQYIYNPAYAGVEDGTQFNLGYRNQWLGFDGSPKTLMLSGYGKFKKKPNMAAGGIIMTERIGLLQRTAFYATYSYHLKINKKAAINFGLGVGGIQHKVRAYDAKPYDKDDVFLGSDVLRAMAFDANAGFYFYTKNFFLGFSDQQMPSAKILWDHSTGKNTNHFYSYSGYSFHLDKTWVIQPSILVRSNSPAPYQVEYNAKVIFDEMIWAGLSYRHKSSLCFMLGCQINKEFTFAYSYDLTLSALNKYSTGSHEIVLSYLIPFKRKKSKSEQVKDADEEELNKIDNSLKTNLKNKKKKEHEKKKEEGTEQPKPEEVQPGTENKTETQPEGIKTPEAGTNTEAPVEKPAEVEPPKTIEAQPEGTKPPEAGTITEPQVEKPAETEPPKTTEGQTQAGTNPEPQEQKTGETEMPKATETQPENTRPAEKEIKKETSTNGEPKK